MAHSLKTLIIDQKPSDMEVEVLNAIKAAGFGVRASYAVNDKKLNKKLDVLEPDLILYRTGFDAISISQLAKTLRDRQLRTPILAVTSGNQEDVTSWMRNGAHDLVDLKKLEHLQLVVRRTARAHVDYLQLQQARTALKAREHLHLNLLESSVDPIAYIHEGMHIHANKAYLELFGHTAMDDIEGLPLMDMVPEYERQHLKVLLTSYQDNFEFTESARIEILLPDGPTLAKLDLSPAEYDGENCMQLVIHLLTPTQSSLTGQFDYLAIYDVACGLYTRNHLLEQLESFVDGGPENSDPYAVVLLSIDNYDELETRLGYNQTHQLYAEIAAHLKHYIDLDDILCRYHTSSYGLLLSRSNAVEITETIGTLLQSINDSTITLADRAIPCTLSAGINTISENATDVPEVIEGAEKALKKAQEEKTELVLFQAEIEEKPQRIIDQEWADRLRMALKENRLKLVFQPIVYLRSEDAPQHYDIMLRMRCNDGTFVTPSEFLKSAERTGLAKGLDRWVIINAFKTIEQRQKQDRRCIFSIKLTEDSIRHQDAVDWIFHELQEQDLDASRIVFEIKSSMLIAYLEEAQELITTLSPLGCQFTVDQFNGVIDLDQIIRHLNVHYIKLESEFLKSLEQHPRREEMLNELLEKAHANGIQVVMKNVEDNRQFEQINRFEIDYVQGNYMHPPGDELDHTLEELVIDNSLFDPTAIAHK